MINGMVVKRVLKIVFKMMKLAIISVEFYLLLQIAHKTKLVMNKP